MARSVISPKLRFQIFKRDNFTCQYCGRKHTDVILEVDHVVPVSGGGDNKPSNLITACYDCNRGKGATGLDECHSTLSLKEKRMSTVKSYFNFNLSEARNNKGLTQREVSEVLGITLRSYQRYESADREPSFKHLIQLSDLLDVSLDSLFGRDTTHKKMRKAKEIG